jgi:hypothetical protein
MLRTSFALALMTTSVYVLYLVTQARTLVVLVP